MLAVAVAGGAIAFTAIATGTATSATTMAGAAGQSAATSPRGAVVLDAVTKPLNAAGYSFGALESIWMAAGGSGSTAYHAACIAEHESGGDPNAISRKHSPRARRVICGSGLALSLRRDCLGRRLPGGAEHEVV